MFPLIPIDPCPLLFLISNHKTLIISVGENLSDASGGHHSPYTPADGGGEHDILPMDNAHLREWFATERILHIDPCICQIHSFLPPPLLPLHHITYFFLNVFQIFLNNQQDAIRFVLLHQVETGKAVSVGGEDGRNFAM